MKKLIWFLGIFAIFYLIYDKFVRGRDLTRLKDLVADLESKGIQALQSSEFVKEAIGIPLVKEVVEVAKLEYAPNSVVKVSVKPIADARVHDPAHDRAHVRKDTELTRLSELSARQQEIYDLIKSEGEVSMATINRKITGVTDRTLRRDMTKLERLGLISQVGKTRDSLYKLRA